MANLWASDPNPPSQPLLMPGDAVIETFESNNPWTASVVIEEAPLPETPELAGKYFVYVSAGRSNRLLIFEQDFESGELDFLDQVALTGGPGPLAVDPRQEYLYAGLSSNQVSAFQIDPKTGGLNLIGTSPLIGNPVYLAVDATGQWLLMADYGQSFAAVYGILPNHAIPGRNSQRVNTGQNAHAILTDPSNRYVYVPTLGSSRVEQYLFDSETGRMAPNDPAYVQKASTAGPRHLTFHPFLNVLYVVNELDSTVTSYRLDPGSGLLSEFQELSSTPEDYEGRRWSADIEITPDGKFLYASNRAIDTLAGYQVDPIDGSLTLIGFTETEQTPRDFGIDPTGRFLYAGGQDSNKLAAFRIDPDTGVLERFATYDAESGPQWVLPLFFPDETGTDPPRLSVNRDENGRIFIVWESQGVLKSSTSVHGTYQIVEGAESPYEVPMAVSGFYILEL